MPNTSESDDVWQETLGTEVPVVGHRSGLKIPLSLEKI